MAEDVINPLIKQTDYKPQWTTRTESIGDEQMRKAKEADEAPSALVPAPLENIDTARRAFMNGDNFAVQTMKQIERIASAGPADPQWAGEQEAWLSQNKDIPEEQRWRYKLTKNRTEAETLKMDAMQQAREMELISKRTGVGNLAARMAAGIVDIDAPLAFMTGGVSAAGKAGIMASKAARLATGAAVGGLVGGALGVAGYEADPNADWSVVPTLGLMGITFGGAGAALAMRSRNAALSELGETLQDGAPLAQRDIRRETITNDDPYHSEVGIRQQEKQIAEDVAAAKQPSPTGDGAKPEAFNVDQLDDVDVDNVLDPVPVEGRSSIGARQLGNTGPGVASIESDTIRNIVQSARTRVQQLGISTDWLDGWQNLPGAKGAVGKQVERFHNAVNSSPLASDFAKLMNSGSAVAQNLAYDVFENASGIIRNGVSAARLQEHYYKETMSKFMAFEDGFSEYASQQGAGFVRRNWDTSIRERFNREVAEELQARNYDKTSITANPAVKRAADSVDATFAHEIKVSQGRPGETGVKGAERLTETSGYMPQKWLGRNIRRMIDDGRATKQNIIDAIAEGYVKMHPQMKLKDAQVYATAVVNRADKFDEGINMNLIGMLQGDGRLALEDMLRNNGISNNEINKFIERIKGAMEERGAAGHTKGRTDIDLRYTASNGIKIMDLVDTDFQTLIPARIRRSAGAASLARKGIASKADWDNIKTAILEEQKANGKSAMQGGSLADKADEFINSDKHLDAEFIDNLYTYFNGQPVAGGISPVYSRMKKLTNLALLNQLGLTQIAELGPTIAAVGWKRFSELLPEAIHGELKKVDSPLVQELKHYSIFVPEENLFRDDLVFEFEKQTATNEYIRNFDRILNKAQRVQGYTSGFYAARRIQQRLAVTAAADKLARHFRDGGLIDDPRLVDMGFTPADLKQFANYAQNGAMEFDAAGNLKRLNMQKWSAWDREKFTLVLNQRVNTLVQKAMAGESSMIFHKDGMASIFFHLKSFPMLAMEKQLLRNTRFMDGEAVATFLYGLGTAGLAYSARQIVNGREENLTAEKITKGAFGYSNMTGWIPMWTDPLAGMLGLDSLQVGGYAGMGNQVISIPAAFTTLDRMATIPGAIRSAGDLELSKGDINSLTSLPIVGNAYGFAYMFNKMKESAGERAKKSRTIQENTSPGFSGL